MKTQKMILLLTLVLSACAVEDTVPDRQLKETFVVAYCERAKECLIDVRDDCFEHIIELLCVDDGCVGEGDERLLSQCLDEFYALECTNPLYLPKTCNNFLYK